MFRSFECLKKGIVCLVIISFTQLVLNSWRLPSSLLYLGFCCLNLVMMVFINRIRLEMQKEQQVPEVEQQELSPTEETVIDTY